MQTWDDCKPGLVPPYGEVGGWALILILPQAFNGKTTRVHAGVH